MTVHGCRALATGIIQERLKIAYIIIDRQLAHVPQSEVRQAYDRAKFWDDRVEMMQRYADYINNLTQPKQRSNHDNTQPNDIITDRATFRYAGRVPYSQQYQPIHFIPAHQSGGDTKAEEKRSLQCMDDDTNSTMH